MPFRRVLRLRPLRLSVGAGWQSSVNLVTPELVLGYFPHSLITGPVKPLLPKDDRRFKKCLRIKDFS
jgi:hypothetical protein